MIEVQNVLDKEIKENKETGEQLKEQIEINSKTMTDAMREWQKDQEQYQHQLHNELLLLSDARNNVTRLNEQIRLLILLQKKSKVT